MRLARCRSEPQSARAALYQAKNAPGSHKRLDFRNGNRYLAG